MIQQSRRQRIPFYRKLNPWWAFFGNEDDGYYGLHTHWNLASSTSLWTAVRWWLRNPAHNFCFYVIGFADRVREVTDDRFHPDEGGWLLSWSRPLNGWFWRPYVSYLGHIRFYAGWRPTGAFGIKLNRHI